MKRSMTLWLFAALALAACGTGDSGGGSSDTTTGDVSEDAAGDVQVDVDDDITIDVGEDTVLPDVGEDTVLPDTGEDTVVPDVGEDTVLPDAEEDTAEDTTPDVIIDAACEDGTSTSFEVVCDDGRFAIVTCDCVDGELACGPDPCGATPTCASDLECGPAELCRICHPEDPVPCDPGCYDTECPTQPVEELVCFATRPVCREGQVAVVASGCWDCVDIATCGEDPPSCDDVGGFCTAGPMGCPDGFETSAEATCDSLSDCCVPVAVASDCTRAGATCVDADVCPDGTDRIRSSCEPEGGICCLGDSAPSCDDGSFLECDMIEPECEEGSVSAVIRGCWECVNPLTCLAWGEPGCATDRDCADDEVCDDCATSSCPFCEDCVAACIPPRGG